jgi:hypothetical protein
MFTRISLCGLFVFGGLYADTLTLKGGKTVDGTYLGGTARQIRMAVGDNV